MTDINDIFKGFGIEVELPDESSFLKVKETLERIGIASKNSNTLFQSCHILHKRGGGEKSRYAVMHFKEMFALDGRDNNFDGSDQGRRNTIVNLLEEWGLLTILNPEEAESPLIPLSKMKIIKHSERNNWNLQSKYNIGGRKSQ